MKPLGMAAFAGVVAATAVANYTTARYGIVDLPFGVAVTAGTFAAGAVLILRDAVQDLAGRVAVVSAIGVAALVSWATSSPQLAMASAAAFALSELLDWAVYSPLRRGGWKRAVLASSFIAAPVDTLIFLALAGFPITATAVMGQAVVKLALAVLAVGVLGAVLRHRVVTRDA